MKISCDIIRDILPLYAEDMVSKATKDMVDEHLCDCEGCTKELESLRQPAKQAVDVATQSLKRVGDSIRRRRILAVATVFLFIATVLIGGALMLDAKIYLSANDAVEDIYVEGDEVIIRWSHPVIGTRGSYDRDHPENYAVTAWTNLYNLVFPTERVPYEALDELTKEMVTKEQYEMINGKGAISLGEGVSDTNFIYVDPRDYSMTLILNAEKPFPEKPLMDVNFHTGYYCIGMVFACILCVLFSMHYRDRWYGELAGRLAVLIGSLALSVVIVKAGQLSGLQGDFHEAFLDSTAVAVPMTLFGLCLRQLIKLNRQDKGM